MSGEPKNLPPRARNKLLAMIDAEAEASALTGAALKRLNEARNALSYRSQNLPPDPQAEAEISRLQQLHAQHQSRYGDLARLNTVLRDWLSRLPATASLSDVRAPKVALNKGETFARAVEKTREAIAATLKQLTNVHRAGLPAVDQKAALRTHVAELAARSKPKISVTHDGVSVQYGRDTMGQWVDTVSWQAWLDPEQLIARLEKEIDAMPRGTLELSPTDKAARMSELRAELDSLERKEEALIVAAGEEGHVIPRRPGASAECVLGVVRAREGLVAA